MNFDVCHVHPPENCVFAISLSIGSDRHFMEVLLGYCHSLLLVGDYAVLEDAFCRRSDVNLCASWAEPVAFGFLLRAEISVKVVSIAPWMKASASQAARKF